MKLSQITRESYTLSRFERSTFTSFETQRRRSDILKGQKKGRLHRTRISCVQEGNVRNGDVDEVEQAKNRPIYKAAPLQMKQHIVQFDILFVRMKSHDRQGTVNRICATDDIPILLSKEVAKTYASIEGPNITKKKMLLSKTEMLTSKETRTLTFLLIFINVATHHAQVYHSRQFSSWLSTRDSFSSILLSTISM